MFFLNASWASTSALAGIVPPLRGFIPRACRNCRTYVGPRVTPGQLGHLGLGCGDRCWGMRQKIGFQRPTILLQDTLPRRDRDLFEVCQPAHAVLREVTIIGRFELSFCKFKTGTKQ